MNDELVAMITLTEFNELLDTYGPDLAAWPQSSHAAAKDLIASDQQAAALYQAANLTENTLSPSHQKVPSAPSGLLDAIMKRVK